MIRLEMKIYNTILIKKQPKYPLHHQVKFINMNNLTGEDVLPSNQQQIIEQAKFTYSPLGKAFEKQIKTIEDQGQKQVDALKDLKPKEQTNAINDKSDDNTSISKEIYHKILKERMNEILKMSREINYSNLVYDFKGSTSSISWRSNLYL